MIRPRFLSVSLGMLTITMDPTVFQTGLEKNGKLFLKVMNSNQIELLYFQNMTYFFLYVSIYNEYGKAKWAKKKGKNKWDIKKQ